jgi:Arc/MetJ-type ribon-helix-helix transcriptional regulator
MSADDPVQTVADSGGDSPASDDLSALLAAVAGEGWGGDAGRRAIGIMRSACRREAAHWVRRAGWLTDEGLSDVWEQMDRLVRSGRFTDAPGLLRVAVRRAYAAEAAAAQTCMGSASTRGLIGAIRSADVHAVSSLDGDSHAGDSGETVGPAAPAWMRTLAAVLAVEGWAWPVPPLHAVMASAAGAASTSRRCRSAMTAHETGVPPATWSALDLLTLGSGPGCRPEVRAIGMSMQFDVLGAVGVRSNRELMRVVRAAVEGRVVRTGRKRAA